MLSVSKGIRVRTRVVIDHKCRSTSACLVDSEAQSRVFVMFELARVFTSSFASIDLNWRRYT
jgi:hypothetical protein